MRLFTRRCMQISLRTFLCLFLVMGIGFGWIGRHVREHRAEQRCIAEIHASDLFSGPWQSAYQSTGSISLPIYT